MRRLEHVHDDGQVQEAGERRHVGDVCLPQPVGGVRRELPIDQVRRRPSVPVAPGRSRLLAPACARQAGLPHQSGDPLAAHEDSFVGQLGPNLRRAIRAPAPLGDRPNVPGENAVRLVPGGPRTFRPGVVPARGDAEHAGHRRDAELGPVRSHEPEDPFGPVSRANQAVALPVSPALPAAGDSHGAGAAAPTAPLSSGRQRAVLRPGPPASPSCGSTALKARTRRRVGPGSARTGPDPPSAAGTLPGTGILILASWIPPPQRTSCPRNRGKLTRLGVDFSTSLV